MPLADDLEEEVCTLVAQGKRPECVTPAQVRGGVMLELWQQRVVRLSRQQLMHHVNGRGTEHLASGVAGRLGHALRQAGLACTGMAHEHDSAVGGDAVEVAQRQETRVLCLSGLMVVAVALVNRPLFCQGGWAPSEMEGVWPAVLQFEVSEEREGRHPVEVFRRRLLQGGVEGLEQACAAAVGELVGEPWGVRHARVLWMTQASESARAGSASRRGLRCGC